jgi:hypothetical protein
VETLKQVSPGAQARYLMIEFDPMLLRGQVLRRHWVAVFETEDGLLVMADSKRPGVISGPYPSIGDFLVEYAACRGRTIVSHREMESPYRRVRLQARRTADRS